MKVNIENYENMTTEEKLAALEAYEPDLSEYVHKATFDKTASDLAAAKRALREKQTDEEAKTQKEAEERAALVARVADLEKEKTITGYANSLSGESQEDLEVFAFVHPSDKGAIRKALKDDLKYVESFVRSGYIGTVAGVNLYTKQDAIAGTICGGTKKAVTFFNKKGAEVEQERDANVRLNEIYARKYYLAALTDDTQCFKITAGA